MQGNEGSLNATQIEYAGDVWHVLVTGEVKDGKRFVHLKSTTKGIQRGGTWHPVYMAAWIDAGLLATAISL